MLGKNKTKARMHITSKNMLRVGCSTKELIKNRKKVSSHVKRNMLYLINRIVATDYKQYY